MQNNSPLVHRTWAPLLILLALIVASMAPAALAQSQSGEIQQQGSASTELSKQEQKERAKQARIEEYLRKKEERRARKELERQQKEMTEAELAAAAATGAAVAAETGTYQDVLEYEEVVLPRELAEAQAILRQNPMAEDPTVAAYLDLIDQAEASPQQLAAFGNFLSQNGASRLALVYYGTALSIEQEDAVLWLNVGTLHRQIQEYSQAADAYGRALSLDPNMAFAHYNLGAVYDEMGKYEAALEEFRIALTLDPSLGDPEKNPQAANNERLLAVKLMLYQEQIGNLGLPLVEVPGGELATLDDPGTE